MAPLITEKIPLHPPLLTSLDLSKPHALNLFHLLFPLPALSGFFVEHPPKLRFS